MFLDIFARWCMGGIIIIENPKPKPKTKKVPIPKHIRNAVWTQYHGERDRGICYCCGTAIQRYNKGWHCSHVIPEAKHGVISVQNMRTCCPHCNLSMGNQNLYAYIRDRQLTGPGAAHVRTYFQTHTSQIHDTRTNNWTKHGSSKHTPKSPKHSSKQPQHKNNHKSKQHKNNRKHVQ